jgi:hypothetical protein
MKLRKNLAASLIVVAAAAGVWAAAGPATAVEPYCVTTPDTSMPGGHDDLNIADQLVDIRGADRGECVQNVVNRAFEQAGGQYNVIVANLSLNYEQHLNGVKFYGNFVRDGVYYGIWVFEDGEFYNNGDGGWQNWGMRGWFRDVDQHVEFHRPGA